jgi:hypothetical protein
MFKDLEDCNTETRALNIVFAVKSLTGRILVSPAKISLGFTLYGEVEDVAATPWRKSRSLVLWCSGN